MTKVNVVDGDITQVRADALITAINPRGSWYGGLDRAIRSVSGGMFHNQAEAAMPLTDGQVVYAPELEPHEGKFAAVLFVVDGLQRPLHEVVTNVLNDADKRRLQVISLPAIRTGFMEGKRETRNRALDDLARAINDFVAKGSAVGVINVVVYGSEADRIALFRACDTRRPRLPQHH